MSLVSKWKSAKEEYDKKVFTQKIQYEAIGRSIVELEAELKTYAQAHRLDSEDQKAILDKHPEYQIMQDRRNALLFEKTRYATTRRDRTGLEGVYGRWDALFEAASSLIAEGETCASKWSVWNKVLNGVEKSYLLHRKNFEDVFLPNESVEEHAFIRDFEAIDEDIKSAREDVFAYLKTHGIDTDEDNA